MTSHTHTNNNWIRLDGSHRTYVFAKMDLLGETGHFEEGLLGSETFGIGHRFGEILVGSFWQKEAD
jgi:hypothetical protein